MKVLFLPLTKNENAIPSGYVNYYLAELIDKFSYLYPLEETIQVLYPNNTDVVLTDENKELIIKIVSKRKEIEENIDGFEPHF